MIRNRTDVTRAIEEQEYNLTNDLFHPIFTRGITYEDFGPVYETKEQAEQETGWIITKRKLGSGGYGSVYLAFHVDDMGKIVPDRRLSAVKVCVMSDERDLCQSWTKAIVDDLIVSHDVISERMCLSCLSHGNIVRMFSFHVLITTKSAYFSLEFCDAGSLQDECKRFPGDAMPKRYARYFLRQIIQGLSYMHVRGVAHNDLKPSNVLLRWHSDGDNIVAKIADFGLSRRIKTAPDETGHQQIVLGTRCNGTNLFLAPEKWAVVVGPDAIRACLTHYSVIPTQVKDVPDFGQLPQPTIDQRPKVVFKEAWQTMEYPMPPCDVFAAGVTLYVMMTGCRPFPNKSWKTGSIEFMDLIFRGEPIPCRKYLSNATFDFITQLLNPNYDQRPTAAQVLEMAWIKGPVMTPSQAAWYTQALASPPRDSSQEASSLSAVSDDMTASNITARAAHYHHERSRSVSQAGSPRLGSSRSRRSPAQPPEAAVASGKVRSRSPSSRDADPSRKRRHH